MQQSLADQRVGKRLLEICKAGKRHVLAVAGPRKQADDKRIDKGPDVQQRKQHKRRNEEAENEECSLPVFFLGHMEPP